MIRHRVSFSLQMLVIVLMGAAPGRGSEPLAAERLLRQFGLVPAGNTWVFPAEIDLRGRLDTLPKLRESILAAERALDDKVQSNRRTWEEAQPTLTALRRQLSRLSSGDKQRKTLQQQIDALQRTATPPHELAGRADVRPLLAELIQQRNQLTLRLLEARQLVPTLVTDYAELARQEEVMTALRQVGEARLGPLRPLQPELRRLGDFDPLVFTSSVPIYLQSGKVRLAAILDERQPITLTWHQDTQHGILMTASHAQTLGLQPSRDATSQVLDISGRKVRATRTQVESLRLGKIVVPQPAVWILAAEAEDLGSHLDLTALPGYQTHLQPERLRLKLEPK